MHTGSTYKTGNGFGEERQKIIAHPSVLLLNLSRWKADNRDALVKGTFPMYYKKHSGYYKLFSVCKNSIQYTIISFRYVPS